ncbi:MFS transporter [Kibdelosporangium persicum]|uniref:Inner membrane transport protein YdhP n=1 Tax=Kibdelosporangium persicum TaxID=2698649 RepID=A0ABX2F6S3_9PSEU|nr:MFS transporter [Kibdelosporangium persicum]NRN67054.1 Inner membrane transport protein YdhP [Kibdelosporangium persicum]
MPVALLALALAVFAMGTAEFVIAGLLPDIASDLDVSIPTAGLLVSGYAMAIVIGGPLFVAAGTRLSHKTLLMLSSVLFVAGNLIAAIAPGYLILMLGRVIGAFGQGAFLAIGSVVAADLVAAGKQARAIALVFTGGTVANVVGAPLGTLIGQNMGWRATFWIITAVGLASALGVLALVPKRPRARNSGLRGELAAFKHVHVWLTLFTGTLGIGALFASFSYVAPLLTDVSGYSPGTLTPLLALFGVGLVIGNLLGGWGSDRAQLPTLHVAFATLAVSLAAFAVFAENQVAAAIALTVMGGAGFALVPAFMSRLIAKADGAPMLAAAVGGSAINLGISAGAYVGGLTIGTALGFTGPPTVGALMATAGLGVVMVSGVLEVRARRRRQAAGAVHTGQQDPVTVASAD